LVWVGFDTFKDGFYLILDLSVSINSTEALGWGDQCSLLIIMDQKIGACARQGTSRKDTGTVFDQADFKGFDLFVVK
jgi:hypothetical protein